MMILVHLITHTHTHTLTHTHTCTHTHARVRTHTHTLDLMAVRDRNIEDLSGGELQRFACAVVCIQRADMLVSILHSIGWIEYHNYSLLVDTCLMSPPATWM